MGSAVRVPVERWASGLEERRNIEVEKTQLFRLKGRNNTISKHCSLSIHTVPGIRLSASQALFGVILIMTHEVGIIITCILQKKEMKLTRIKYPTAG